MILYQLSNTAPSTPGPESAALDARARALAAAGHDVVLFTPADESPPPSGRPRNFTHTRFGPAPTRAPAAALPAPELLHTHDPFLAGEEALRLAELHPVPLVFTARLHYQSPRALPPDEAADLRAFIEKLGLCYANRCDLVIAPSPALAVRLHEGGVVRPIHIVPDLPAADAYADPAALNAAAKSHARHLLEAYAEAAHARRARDLARDCREDAHLRRDLALEWEKLHPAARPRTGRPAAAFSFLRDGLALTC